MDKAYLLRQLDYITREVPTIVKAIQGNDLVELRKRVDLIARYAGRLKTEVQRVAGHASFQAD